MLNDFRTDWRSRLLHWFPERQVYIRSGGEVRSFSLSTRQQTTTVAALAFLVLWCLVTLLNMVWGVNPLRSRDEVLDMRLAKLERAFEQAKANLESERDQREREATAFASATREFEEKHNTLAALMGSTGTVDTVAPITATDYASGSVLMSPVLRDAVPRTARRDAVATTAANSREVTRDFQKLDATQNRFLVEAEASTLERIEIGRAIVAAADMDVSELLQQATEGKGGPFVEVSLDDMDADGFGSRMASIKARVAEADALDSALLALPTGHPVADEHYRTSGFGMRRDPFTKRPTFHEGLDFGGRKNAPIVATAPGVVTKVGRNGGYGRVVEIDHGYGFVTRYAHLEKTFVKRGQAVEQGDVIAGMGSTGRSTATHLHYEIHFQGRVFDPSKFLKAGRYVQ